MSAEQELAIAFAMHEEYRKEVNLWRARYMAAHDVLLAVEEHIERVEDWATPAPSRGPAASALPSYKALRAAFLAYRAAIESGAPLGWAVAEAAPVAAEVGDERRYGCGRE